MIIITIGGHDHSHYHSASIKGTVALLASLTSRSCCNGTCRRFLVHSMLGLIQLLLCSTGVEDILEGLHPASRHAHYYTDAPLALGGRQCKHFAWGPHQLRISSPTPVSAGYKYRKVVPNSV